MVARRGEDRHYVPDRGDIVWVSFARTEGHEQAGRRPGLVLSPAAYNGRVGLALLCPVTSVEKGYPFEVALPPDGAVHGVVLSDQIRSLDWRARHTELASRVPEAVVSEVLAKLEALLR